MNADTPINAAHSVNAAGVIASIGSIMSDFTISHWIGIACFLSSLVFGVGGLYIKYQQLKISRAEFKRSSDEAKS